MDFSLGIHFTPCNAIPALNDSAVTLPVKIYSRVNDDKVEFYFTLEHNNYVLATSETHTCKPYIIGIAYAFIESLKKQYQNLKFDILQNCVFQE